MIGQKQKLINIHTQSQFRACLVEYHTELIALLKKVGAAFEMQTSHMPLSEDEMRIIIMSLWLAQREAMDTFIRQEQDGTG